MKTFLALAIMLFASVASAADASRITLDNYNRVQENLPLQSVRSVLGTETMIDFQSGRFKTLVWRVGSAEDFTKLIRVTFKDDKVSGKSQYGL